MNTFVADILRENYPTLDVFFHSGFDVASHCDYGTVSLCFLKRLRHARRPPAPSYEPVGVFVAPSEAALDAHNGRKSAG